MNYKTYTKLANAALISVLTLIFAGAIVRVTGAGMGCPDWPTCWGMLIPPTSVEEVNFEKLDIKKFQEKAERMGRNPSTISRESLRAEFNSRHVWTEFTNRLLALPVGFFSLATFIASFRFKKIRPLLFWLSFSGLLLVLTNAWMGARVVYSGISPGVLSTHLALAMALICVLTFCVWAGAERPLKVKMSRDTRLVRMTVLALLVLVVTEGILGTQIREMTDELSKTHLDSPRETWIGKLEQSITYYIHRSFSWVLLLTAVFAFTLAKKHQPDGVTPSQVGVLAIMFTQMILGLVMAQIHIYSWVQVLHVGLASILLALVFRWFLITPHEKSPVAEAGGC
jgi:heme a synthase